MIKSNNDYLFHLSSNFYNCICSVMHNSSSVDKNLKDFEALLEKCNSSPQP